MISSYPRFLLALSRKTPNGKEGSERVSFSLRGVLFFYIMSHKDVQCYHYYASVLASVVVVRWLASVSGSWMMKTGAFGASDPFIDDWLLLRAYPTAEQHAAAAFV